MQPIWKDCLKTDLTRLIFTATNIKNFFYQKNSFLVLPYLIEGNAHSVYFPDYDYEQLPQFWAQIPDYQAKKEAATLNNQISPQLKKILLNNLQREKISSRELKTIKTKWQKHEKSFLQFIQTLFPSQNTTIFIHPTRLGSLSSYYIEKKKSATYIDLYYRIDTPLAQLAEVMITALILNQSGEYKKLRTLNWQYLEATTDYLFMYTKLKKIFPDYIPTTHITNKPPYSKKQFSQSQDYLKKLGFITNSNLTFKHNKIYICNQPVPEGFFSPAETNILIYLLTNQGKILSFRQAAKLIWGNHYLEKFSLWALAKRVEILRQKLSQLGLNYYLIKTKRKHGYLLAD